MKSSLLVVIITLIFVIFASFTHNKINDFSNGYLKDFNRIESNIINNNWDEADTLLSKAIKDFDKEKNIWYKLINHGYFNEIFMSIEILNKSIYLEDKMISLQELERIKMTLQNLMEDELCNFNRIF